MSKNADFYGFTPIFAVVVHVSVSKITQLWLVLMNSCESLPVSLKVSHLGGVSAHIWSPLLPSEGKTAAVNMLLHPSHVS